MPGISYDAHDQRARSPIAVSVIYNCFEHHGIQSTAVDLRLGHRMYLAREEHCWSRPPHLQLELRGPSYLDRWLAMRFVQERSGTSAQRLHAASFAGAAVRSRPSSPIRISPRR
ncbi:uncharacterized protein [Triticum aestivum]|uniref:uncharacterized protein n=1 Tax=Triticum aestivum TaxID=4565 RepID=UPI001D026C65|nr:uncharacterized protein LOC123059622 [Triticum aestivum]XP_044338082.1 uncharacterized protein LOC123059624 [Triticum aestivum]XP_044338083.1 uncharacterized protein LOC123059625 [Triticum aestivum]